MYFRKAFGTIGVYAKTWKQAKNHPQKTKKSRNLPKRTHPKSPSPPETTQKKYPVKKSPVAPAGLI